MTADGYEIIVEVITFNAGLHTFIDPSRASSSHLQCLRYKWNAAFVVSS